MLVLLILTPEPLHVCCVQLAMPIWASAAGTAAARPDSCKPASSDPNLQKCNECSFWALQLLTGLHMWQEHLRP